MKKLLSLVLLLLAACTAQHGNYQNYLHGRNLPEATPESFPVCRAYGCQKVDIVSFTKKDWKWIEKTFRPAPKNAEQERKRIAKAIAVFEQQVGAITGTDVDVGNTFTEFGAYQQDCVDESTNTTIYLSLLAQKKLLKFHTVEPPTSRVPLIHYAGRWPHQTAVISEKDNPDAFFAVDSWFHDNGAPADIVPLKEWKSGWRPPKD
jgi:hypothetical protein